MSFMYYDGHTHALDCGATVRHVVEEDGLITVAIGGTEASEGGVGFIARLTADEAQKLATALLRDVSLVRFGVG